MPPKNRKCPHCGQTINVLRAPVFAGKNYCSSDCAIDAWYEAKLEAETRRLKAAFGEGTK